MGNLIQHNKILKEKVIAVDNSALNENKKVQSALEIFCLNFDLEKPMWFDNNTKNCVRFP
ncbi:MAG TPA: hypothetical protein DCY58_08945 [Acetobacterium sp.]|nr:MAG: hypothetical protein BI182_02805 [Acetobacterium sp. MES1]HAZ06322.1 hypothetical protein [Acetobacterium sp.]